MAENVVIFLNKNIVAAFECLNTAFAEDVVSVNPWVFDYMRRFLVGLTVASFHIIKNELSLIGAALV
jgi:hypothetical protein